MKRGKWVMATALALGLSAGAFAQNQSWDYGRNRDDAIYSQRDARDRAGAWSNGYREDDDRGRAQAWNNSYGDRDDHYRDRDDHDRQARNRDHHDRDHARRDRDDRGRDRN